MALYEITFARTTVLGIAQILVVLRLSAQVLVIIWIWWAARKTG